jgi:hypothetical protein
LNFYIYHLKHTLVEEGKKLLERIHIIQIWSTKTIIGKIYTKEEIDKAKQPPSFDREYDLKYAQTSVLCHRLLSNN